MTEEHKTGVDVLVSRIGDLAAMVLHLSRAVERLASEPDEAERHELVTTMRGLRAVIADWGVELPSDLH